MADDRLDSTALLTDWLAQGCKPPSAWRIGTEHEKIGFDKTSLAPLPYDGAGGIKAMLEGLQQFGWQGNFENGQIIGLTRPPKQGGGSVTLEPGGQLELSGAPLETIHQTCREVNTHLQEVRQIGDGLNQGYMGIGFSPLWELADAAQMPKGRYDLMRRYMPSTGRYGLDMMYLSATVQVNLDFASEADMVEKMRIGLALQPLATALFANSPFRAGQPTGNLSERSFAWTDLDPARTGILPFVFEENFGFERYVEYALDVPMYFIIRDGQYIDALGMSFRDFMHGACPALMGEKPTARDWENHLGTLFPEARLKRFIEMRGADSGADGRLCALPALWVGLLYDAPTQKKAVAMISDWTQEERDYLRTHAPVTGLHTPFRDGTMQNLARDMLALADAGLKARGKLDDDGKDESQFLQPLHEVAETGRTPAEILLEKYHGAWGGDMRPLFDALSL